MPPRAPTVADLVWLGDLRFSATFKKSGMTLDGQGREGPSPVDSLAGALASCMSADVVHVVTKERHPLKSLRVHLSGERAEGDPHRFVRVTLHLSIGGDVPAEAIDHAIAESRAKYCSVWHSMRQDIDFTVTWDREAPPEAAS